MSDILLDEQSVPSAPSSGQGVVFIDNATARAAQRTSALSRLLGPLLEGSTADQLLGTGDTYVTGSRVLVPSFGLLVGARYVVELSLSKTGAGTAAPVWTVRMGTAGTTADASQWTHTGVAQTAVAETGYYKFMGVIRSIGGSGVMQGSLKCVRTGGTAATGLASVPLAQVTGAAADKAWASGQGIGLSINAGGSSAWTVTQVRARLEYP